MTNEEILKFELPENDADARTVKEYFINLALAVWDHGEGFSGKRPFGNSGWEYDVIDPLIEAGVDETEVYGIVYDAVASLKD